MRVYIASPYTLGDVAVNVKRQIDAFNELMNKGYQPFAPLLAHFIHLVHPKSYEQWMSWDLGLRGLYLNYNIGEFILEYYITEMVI